MSKNSKYYTVNLLPDCCMITQNDSIVAGGGAIEMELSKYLRDYSRTIPGKQQLLIGAYAKALEVIPRQLCDNAGFDATNILNKLRAKHAQVGGVATLYLALEITTPFVYICAVCVGRAECGSAWTSTMKTSQITSSTASGSLPSCASTP